MYPISGTLPITGANLIAFALTGGAFVIVGVIMLRLAFFLKKRKAAATVLKPRKTALND